MEMSQWKKAVMSFTNVSKIIKIMFIYILLFVVSYGLMFFFGLMITEDQNPFLVTAGIFETLMTRMSYLLLFLVVATFALYATTKISLSQKVFDDQTAKKCIKLFFFVLVFFILVFIPSLFFVQPFLLYLGESLPNVYLSSIVILILRFLFITSIGALFFVCAACLLEKHKTVSCILKRVKKVLHIPTVIVSFLVFLIVNSTLLLLFIFPEYTTTFIFVGGYFFYVSWLQIAVITLD